MVVVEIRIRRIFRELTINRIMLIFLEIGLAKTRVLRRIESAESARPKPKHPNAPNLTRPEAQILAR
jgi:hypothetical protein